MYCGVHVTEALVDPELEALSSLYLSCEIPRGVRALAPDRPDVMMALLTEDEELQTQIRPFYTWNNTQIRLVHIAVRPTFVNYLLHPKPVDGLREALDFVRSRIGRITHANSDHRDCRMENLREVTG